MRRASRGSLPFPLRSEGRETVEELGEAGGVSSSSSEESLADVVEAHGGVPMKVELDDEEDDEGDDPWESAREEEGSEVKVGSFDENRDGRTSRIIVTSIMRGQEWVSYTIWRSGAREGDSHCFPSRKANGSVLICRDVDVLVDASDPNMTTRDFSVTGERWWRPRGF